MVSGAIGTVEQSALEFGRDVVADPALREAEWLVANGIGGYASGTVCGMPTRGYHGLLVASLRPPLDRRVLAPAVVEMLEVAGRSIPLTSLRWADGTVSPDCAESLLSFALDGGVAVWRFEVGGVAVEKRLWMDHGANVTRIGYRLARSIAPATLRIDVLTGARDYHSRSFASDWLPGIRAEGDLLTATYGEIAVHARLDRGEATAEGVWWRGLDLAEERRRGLTDREDHVHAGRLTVTLVEGEETQLVLSEGATPAAADSASLQAERARQAALIDAAALGDAPPWVRRLTLAADQFVARRFMRDGTPAHTIIAGYHWFADWGRDTMISLPGLTLTTGRAEIARSILKAFADVLDGGMIPNRFPDAGEAPEYNTVDATFWFVEALAALDAAAPDDAFLDAMFPALEDIVGHLRSGTRYGITLDPADGLIRAGEPGVQLTWMDARVGDREITPRIGKPVEVNALWISNLRFMAAAARRLNRDSAPFEALLAAALAGFGRFWNPDRGFLFDVLDGPAGHEAALRPNQILAARARTGALSREQAARVVAACEAELWTPCGLRSLGQSEAGYLPRYGGDQSARDGAYHMGTVWAWLIGPFIEAHLDVHGDRARAMALLAPLADQLRIGGLGTVGEIFEAAAPHGPRGCIAQAWSVGEMLRAWALIARPAPAAD